MTALFRTAPLLVALAACRGENGLNPDEYDEPTLRIDDPKRAAWEEQGAATVGGLAEHLVDVSLNGEPVTVDAGAFTADFSFARGVNLLEARGIDERGDAHFVREGLLAGEFASPGAPVDDGAWVRVNESGIDVLLDKVGESLDDEALAATIMAANPVYEDTYEAAGFKLVNVQADVTELWFSHIEIDGDPKPDRLDLSLTIADLDLFLLVSGDVVGLDFDVEVEMWSDEVQGVAVITLDAAAGKLVVDIDGAAMNFVGFGWDTDLIPGEILEEILVDTVRETLEEKLVEQLETQVPALLGSTLAELELSYETELLGQPVAVAATFASAGIDEQGIQLGMDIDVEVQANAGYDYAGYLVAPQADPSIDRYADLAMSVHDDLLNRVLFEAWKGGMLVQTLSTDDGSLEPIMLAALKAEEGTINVRADLPPVAVQERDQLVAQVTELEIEVLTPGGELGDRLVLMVTAYVPLELQVDAGVLKLGLGKPEVVLAVRESDWGASNEATTALLEEMLPLDVLLGLLGDIEFPLPALAGITIGGATVARDASGAHTSVAADLQ